MYQVNEVNGHVYVCQGYRLFPRSTIFQLHSGTVPTVMYIFLFHFIPSNENYFLLAIV